MIPPAKRSLTAGIVILLAGAIVVANGTDAYLWLTDLAGATAEPGLRSPLVALLVGRSRGWQPLAAVFEGYPFTG